MEGFGKRCKEIVRTLMDGKHETLRKCIFFLLAGVCLLIILWPTKQKDGGSGTSLITENVPEQEEEEDKTEQTSDENGVLLSDNRTYEVYISSLENRLTQMLVKVKGIGDVEVMITLSDSGEKIVEKDVSQVSSQSDTDSQTSNSETSVMSDASGANEPYVSKVLEPEIEGVLVTCTGAGNPEVVVQITEAVQALFDVPAHKIVVLEQE